MLTDRRKPWQKAANIKWARCGHVLSDTARDLARYGCVNGSGSALLDYAKALGVSIEDAQARANAQTSRLAEFRFVLPPSGLSSEERRKQGRKILAQVRASIDKRMIGGLGPNAGDRSTPDKAWKAYVEALGHDPRERLEPMAQAA